MGHISKCIFLLMLSSGVVTAQIVRPGELIKRKSEQRVNQKIEGAIDGALDKIFGVGKQKQSDSRQSESKSFEHKMDSISVNAFDAMQAMKNLRLGITPKSTYQFSSSFRVLTRSFDTKGIELTNTMKYHFTADGTAMAVTSLAEQGGESSGTLQNMDAFIIDFDLSAIFSFMRVDSKKIVVGTGFTPMVQSGTNTPEKAVQTKVTLTSQTKRIGEYVCDGYLVEEEGNQMMVWISKSRIDFFADYLKKMSDNSRQLSKMFPNMDSSTYQSHPELGKVLKEGRIVLGISKLGDKYESFDMEFRDFVKDDFFLLKSSDYSSMLGN